MNKKTKLLIACLLFTQIDKTHTAFASNQDSLPVLTKDLDSKKKNNNLKQNINSETFYQLNSENPKFQEILKSFTPQNIIEMPIYLNPPKDQLPYQDFKFGILGIDHNQKPCKKTDQDCLTQRAIQNSYYSVNVNSSPEYEITATQIFKTKVQNKSIFLPYQTTLHFTSKGPKTLIHINYKGYNKEDYFIFTAEENHPPQKEIN